MDGWRVYLLECADGSYYCGIARDLAKRLAQHNGERPGGARYTRARKPVKLIAATRELSRSDALRMEARIKKLRREAKPLAIRAHGDAICQATK